MSSWEVMLELNNSKLRDRYKWCKMSEITKRKKGQMLNHTERQLILNLMNYLKSKDSKQSISEIVREISKATGCSERTIYKIKKEASKGITVPKKRTRLRKKENKNSRNVKYDSFVKSSIRKKIHNYFLQNSSPTLNTVLHLVNSDPDLPKFKRSTLHTLLKEIGFVYELKGKKSFLTESRNLVELRQAYLRDVKKYRNENRWIVYTGETVISLIQKEVTEAAVGINKQQTEGKCEKSQLSCESINTLFMLQNGSELVNGTGLVYTIDAIPLGNVVLAENLHLAEGISVVHDIPSTITNIQSNKVTLGKDATGTPGQLGEQAKTDSNDSSKKLNKELRLTIMHAGSEQGFIQGVDFIALTRKKNEEVEKYKNWFLEKLLPKMPPNSVIITDNNAPYHRVEENFPNVSWKKKEIKNWLLSKNLKVDNLSQKKELLSVVNQVRPVYSTNYKINEIAKERGIIILSLPPFHYELNPLNMVWAQVKYYVRSNLKSFKIKSIKQLIRESFYSISQLGWMNYMHHVKEVEDLLWNVDGHQGGCQNFSISQENAGEEC